MSEQPPHEQQMITPEAQPNLDYAGQLRFGAYDGDGRESKYYKLKIDTDDPKKFLDSALIAMDGYANSPDLVARHGGDNATSIQKGEYFCIGRNRSGRSDGTTMRVVPEGVATEALRIAVGTVALDEYMKDMKELREYSSSVELDDGHRSSSSEEIANTTNTTGEAQPNTETIPEESQGLGSSGEESNRPEISLEEAVSKYGFEEDASAEYVINELESALSRLDGMLKFHSNDVSGVFIQAIPLIKATLEGGGTVHFAGNKREAMREILLGLGERSFRRMVAGMDTTHLSKATKSRIEGLSRQLLQAGNAFEDATRRGSNFIADEPAGVLLKLLGRINDVDPLSKEARALRQDINDLRRAHGMPELEVFAKPGNGAESSDGEVEFRNEQVKKWAAVAAELKEAGVDDPRLEKLVDDIRNSVATESGMDADPNSPRIWFGDRVRDDDNKNRAIPRAGQSHTKSQRYVAELVADMLRGSFDTGRSKQDKIRLNPNVTGGVELGQHRAAALAMIYGSEWTKKATSMGALE